MSDEPTIEVAVHAAPAVRDDVLEKGAHVGRYVVDQIIARPETFRLGGDIRRVAILFPVTADSLGSVLGFAFEVFLIFCLFHQESRRYARIWLDD